LGVGLVELAVFATVVFLAGLLEAFRRPGSAAAVLVAALLTGQLLPTGSTGVAGAAAGTLPVLAGGIAACCVAALRLGRVFREPDQAFAIML